MSTKTFTVESDMIYKALGEIINKIEACGASVELTQIVALAGDLRQAVGNQYNMSDPYALIRITEAMRNIL